MTVVDIVGWNGTPDITKSCELGNFFGNNLI